MIMAGLLFLRLIWLLFIFCKTIACSSRNFSPQCCALLTPHYSKFEQQITDFWTYDRSSCAWRKIDIGKFLRQSTENDEIKQGASADTGTQDFSLIEIIHPYNGMVSLTKFSDASLWSSGHGGSIYERLWNGVQWVIIPHDIPNSSGYATGVYSVNRTMLALSDVGRLYQLQIDSEGHLQWVSSGPWPSSTLSTSESSSILLRKSALLSSDGSSLFFISADGWLAELWSLHPVRWTNHGQPRGADVAHVVDAGGFRAGMVFTVSTSGELYEYDARAKPAWRKHIRNGSAVERYELAPGNGFSVHDFAGVRSFSLFLLTKNGLLVERRFAQAKWRWLLHARPSARLSFSLGPVITTRIGKIKNLSFFLVSEHGTVYEYKLPFLHGNMRSTSFALQNGTWKDHGRPAEAAVMVSIPGVILSLNRIFFALQDGRLGELHKHGFGGVNVGPSPRSDIPKSQHGDYIWSVFEAPESEGGNSDYCSAALGPSNCLEGILDTSSNFHTEQQQTFGGIATEQEWSRSVRHDKLFRARTLHFGKSFFLVGEDGVAAERFLNGNTWLWLKHESPYQIQGVLGVYNGSVHMLDVHGSLLIREWNGDKLQWLNASALEGGSRISGGSPWDGLFGEVRTVTLEDAQCFVSEKGDLLELLVAFRAFGWNNCGHPQDTVVAAIMDKEVLRYRVIFVVGANGRLYQFNRITRFWHTYDQPSQLKLSTIPGVTYRPSFLGTSGSLFMRGEIGNLIEFGWDHSRGWVWSDHGFPTQSSYLATSPGPCMEMGSILVVSSDGRVHARQLVDGKWRWKDYGHPFAEQSQDNERQIFIVEDASRRGGSENLLVSFEGDCDPKVESVRPIAMTRDLAIFVLRDGRLAELKKHEDGSNWDWLSIVDTPTSTCHSNYWTQEL